jgi:hypothetical protein
MTDLATTVGWYTSIATSWPIWTPATGYSLFTPYPANAINVSTPNLLALDVNNKGVVVERHDYLNYIGASGRTFGPGYWFEGQYTPIEQFGAGYSEYFFGNGIRTYRDDAQSRTDFADNLAPFGTLRDSSSRIVFAVTEFGMDSVHASESALVRDKALAYKALGAQVQLWWLYSTASIASDPWSARPSGTWRQSIVNWMNAT